MRIASAMCSRLDVGRRVAIVDPLVAVGRDLPARLVHRRDRLGIARHRGRDRVDGHRNRPLGEHAMQAPEAGARAVFVDRLHVHVAHAGPGRGADDLRQERLRGGVAVQDVVLAALLVVDDELHRDARLVRPVGEGRRAPVADHVARIGFGARHTVRSSRPSRRAAERYDTDARLLQPGNCSKERQVPSRHPKTS